MKTVLVLTVGGSPDPIINAIHQNSPEFVFFLCSGGSNESASEKQIPEILKKIGITHDHCKVVAINNPDDLNSVLSACAEIEQEINDRFEGQCRVVANYTGGTKTMTLGLGSYALQRAPKWDLQANIGPRKDTIKVVEGDIAQKIDLSTFFHQNLSEEIRKYEEDANYEGAIAILNQILTSVTLQTEIRNEFMQSRYRMEMMAAWDRLDYQQAESKAELISDKSYKSKFKILRRITEFFQEEEKSEWNVKDVSGHQLVEDLLENANRCYKRSRYDDAMGRLYRATELSAQIKLL